jgi:protein SCO1/2
MRGAGILAAIGALLMAVGLGTWAAMRWALTEDARRAGVGTPLEAATVEEHLGWKIPLDLHFTDTEGRRERLGAFMGVLSAEGVPLAGTRVAHADAAPGTAGRPLLLVLAYFNCRTLCNLVLQGTARTLAELEWRTGADYRLLTVSIDPRDTPLDARQKRAELGAPDWTFLVGEEAEIRELTSSLGFGYRYDEATDQFSHPAVIFALTPAGGISSYIYGIDPEPAEVAASLREAAVGGTRTTLQRVLLRCYHYIPALRRYAGLVRWLLRACGALTLLGFGALVWRLIRRVPRREVAA